MDNKNVVGVYSIDLSAAFDLLRADVLIQDLRHRKMISEGLSFLILDFLWKRKFLVDIDGDCTGPVDLDIGCVQGSTLGPRLFTLYCGDLATDLGCDHFISYADDSYVVVYGKTLDEVKEKITSVSKLHIKKLKLLGMKVNESKSEVVIFGKNQPVDADIYIGDVIVKSTATMKVLGITFDSKLTWEPHVTNLVKKCNAKLTVLRKLRHKFTVDQFMKIVTSQYYSILYYCAPVWLNDVLKSNLKRRINSAHFKALRIALNDYKNRIPRKDLTTKCGRATPNQWYKYATATAVIKILNTKKPMYSHSKLSESLYTTRRKPLIGRFFDNSRGKIGKQSLENRLSMMDAIGFDWIDQGLSDDRLRQLLKKAFFTY